MFFGRRKISSDKRAMAMEFVEARVCGWWDSENCHDLCEGVGWREGEKDFFFDSSSVVGKSQARSGWANELSLVLANIKI